LSSFSGQLNNGDAFGISITSLGDMNYDGIPDIAAGSWGPDEGGTDRGAFWVFFMDNTGLPKSYQKVSTLTGGFNVSINDGNGFGVSLSSPGDLNYDGIPDILVGSNLDDDGGPDRGAFWLLFMNKNGTVNSSQKYSSLTSGMPTLHNSDNFGVQTSYIKDRNHDGIPELVSGTMYDDDGAIDAGALYIIFSKKNFTAHDIALSNAANADITCYDSAINVKLKVANIGDTAITNYKITTQISGDTSYTVTTTNSTTLGYGKQVGVVVTLPIPKPGIYNVISTISYTDDTDPYNNTTTTVKYIRSSVNPDFTSDHFCQMDTVAFTNKSVGIQTTISGYQWDFGDGNTSLATNPAHHYTKPGNYTVTLNTRSAQGCVYSTTKSITVLPQPQASFTATTVCLGQTTKFTNTSKTDTGTIKTVYWDFGDSSTAANANPVHIYSHAGTFPVKLYVTNSIGCTSAVMTQNVTVNPLPKAAFSATGRCETDSASFTNLSTGTTYKISYGDGFSSINPNLKHKYSRGGDYKVTLTATNASGCQDTVSEIIHIYSTPQVSFKAKNVCIGDETDFSDSIVKDQQSDLQTVAWDFGDGKTWVGENPTHTYHTAGKYGVTLKVITDIGCEAEYTDTTYVFTKPSEQYKRKHDTLYISGAYKSYQWYKNYAPVTGATKNYFIIKDTAYYTVVLTNVNGCSDSLPSRIENPDASINGIEDAVSSEMTIYPNPTSGSVNISFTEPLANRKIAVYDLEGKRVYASTQEDNAKNVIVDLSKLPAGMYILNVTSEKTFYRARIIKD
jgi:PKD repeat protein